MQFKLTCLRVLHLGLCMRIKTLILLGVGEEKVILASPSTPTFRVLPIPEPLGNSVV